MRNTMEIGGYRAIIQFDPDIEMFRGEFVGLNGGADFYARDVRRSQEGGRGIAQGVSRDVRGGRRRARTPVLGEVQRAHPVRAARERRRRRRRRREESESMDHRHARRPRRTRDGLTANKRIDGNHLTAAPEKGDGRVARRTISAH